MPGASFKAAASPDTDGDLILDRVEKASGCSNYQLTDTDGDDLSDSQEDANRNGIHELALNETSACNGDTDGDRIDDKWERDYGLDPLTDDADQDPDGDKLTNLHEYMLGTNPDSYDIDNDNDTLPDWFEFQFFGNLSQRPNDDYDFDGFTNYQEYAAGGNPADRGNRPNPGLYYEYDALGRLKKICRIPAQ